MADVINARKSSEPTTDEHVEYVIKIRLATNEGSPAKWKWDDILDDFVFSVEAAPTGFLYRQDPESGDLKQVDFRLEPRLLLGQWVLVLHNETAVTAVLADVTDEELVLSSVVGTVFNVPRDTVKSLMPTRNPKAK
jgi:hypothetical protein